MKRWNEDLWHEGKEIQLSWAVCCICCTSMTTPSGVYPISRSDIIAARESVSNPVFKRSEICFTARKSKNKTDEERLRENHEVEGPNYQKNHSV